MKIDTKCVIFNEYTTEEDRQDILQLVFRQTGRQMNTFTGGKQRVNK